MKGYSKIKVSSSSSPTSKPRSKEPPSAPVSPPPKDPTHTPKGDDGGGGGEGGERFGVVLSRTCSSASQRFAEGSGHGGVQGVVRRAFSMRKQPSSSVADGYWRIGDGNGDDGKDGSEDGSVVRRTRKRGRIYRACKKIFRF